MSGDLTVHAEALIATVARAFYEDDAICLIDVLLRDKYLRDDDMGPRLSLQAKQLRKTLTFLQEEHIVKFEEVDDLSQGGSQQTKFWYIDYNHAVHTIRLRLHLLRKSLQDKEMEARSSSFYLCPGFKVKRCNGRYTEEEAQQVVDVNTGLFLCQECSLAYENLPSPPPLDTYTLQLVDNAQALKAAVNNMRRVHVQISGKSFGSNPIRPSIYDLLQKVRPKGMPPLTSNLPSENFALGIGSKRLAGTGRTAGLKAKKRALQHQSNTAAVGTTTKPNADDLTFLKNAMGQEIVFTVEKGGGARAQLLATNKRRITKLMDAAASHVATALPMYYRWKQLQYAEMEKNAQKNINTTGVNGKRKELPSGPDFLLDGIGRKKSRRQEDDGNDKKAKMGEATNGEGQQDGVSEYHPELDNVDGVVLVDDNQELLRLPDQDRIAKFQAQYKMEKARQTKLLLETPKLLEENGKTGKEGGIEWEDGWMEE